MKHLVIFFSFFSLLLVVACSGPYQIRDGNTAFDLKKYALAVELYAEEYENARMRENRAEKSFLLAESYYRMGNFKAASQWYEVAIGHGYGLRAREGKARTLMNRELYTEAEEAYKSLITDFGQLDSWSNNMRAAGIATELIQRAKEKNLRISEPLFNSYFSDYAPAFFADNILVFSSDRIENPARSNTYSWTGRGFFNFLTFDKKTGQFIDDFEFLNSKFNEGTISFTEDRKTVFFTRCKSENSEDGFCRIYVSHQLSSGIWTNPEELNFQKGKVNFMHPTINKDGNMLIFSHKPEEHDGGFDLYVSYLRANEWLDPIPLEGSVNTNGNESFPHLFGDTLYFASDGHPGMGGLDIFRAVLQADRSWGAVENLLPPINSGADDFAYVPNPYFKTDGKILRNGYFSSSRGSTTDNIYFFEEYIGDEEDAVEVVYSILLRGIVMEQLFEVEGDPNSRRLGTRNLPFANVEVINNLDTLVVKTGRDSRFEVNLEADQIYRVAASADGYFRQSRLISTEGFSRDPQNPREIIDLQIVLERLFVDLEIVLEDILYDFDRWEIREDAQPTLDRLSQILQDNPKIIIELGSHTDCRGSDDYNLNLSQNRAQAAVNYLVENGISRDRLIAKGYGKSSPRIDCICEECTEEEHQINRRTSFKILSD
jgi:peptidoglycan-associated lipoprotein